MSFAENKTKTWHDRLDSWGIGTVHPKLRFLGYWLETPTPAQRLKPPTFEHHLSHWTTKANYTLIVLRALSTRSSKGLRTPAILRILDACCRSTLLYGLEFWSHLPDLTQKADSFIYEAIRRLFDMPIATPYRAISSEFGIILCSLRYNTIIKKIPSRLLRHRPLQFMDQIFSSTPLENKITSSIDNNYSDLPAELKELPNDGDFLINCVDFSGEISFDDIKNCDLLVFTDGSYKNDVASFGFCIFLGTSWKENISLYESCYVLTPRKSILDAEAIALVVGLQHSLSLGYTGTIYLFSDNQAALRIFVPHAPRDLLYLAPKIRTLLRSTARPIQPAWVKGHSGNKENDKADALAKSATLLFDHYTGPSYLHLNLSISTQSTTEWNDWFDRTTHFYKRRPTRCMNHHRHLSRLDTIALFKLRTTKGWNQQDNIGTQAPPPCVCNNPSPRDGAHLSLCPIYSRLHPPDILDWIHLDKYIKSVLKWIRHHRHFGLKPSTSQVRWINLTKPGNLALNRTFKCDVCARDFTSNLHLKLHQERIHSDGISTSFAWDHTNQCQECMLSFNSKRELDDHVSSTHGCKDCTYKCQTASNMKKHMTFKHGGIPCNGCSLRFPGRIALRQHQPSNCGGSHS